MIINKEELKLFKKMQKHISKAYGYCERISDMEKEDANNSWNNLQDIDSIDTPYEAYKNFSARLNSLFIDTSYVCNSVKVRDEEEEVEENDSE